MKRRHEDDDNDDEMEREIWIARLMHYAENDSEDDDDDYEFWNHIAAGYIQLDTFCRRGPKHRRTPLLAYAIGHSLPNIAMKLLRAGANPILQFRNGPDYRETPAWVAILNGRRDLLRVMLDMGLTVESTCRIKVLLDFDGKKQGEDALDMLSCALLRGSTSTIELLCTHKYVSADFLRSHYGRPLTAHTTYANRQVIKRVLDRNTALEAAWCTTWLTYTMIRGAWRHLCPIIVDGIMAAGDPQEEDVEPVSKKIKN